MNEMRLFQPDSELHSQCEVLQRTAKYIQLEKKISSQYFFGREQVMGIEWPSGSQISVKGHLPVEQKGLSSAIWLLCLQKKHHLKTQTAFLFHGFFFLHEKKITLVNMLLKKFAASYVSYVRLQYELAWLDVNRVTLEERRCQGKKIYYHSTIPLLHTLNYTYLLLSQYLTMVTFLLFSCPHHMVIPLLASAFNMFLFIL